MKTSGEVKLIAFEKERFSRTLLLLNSGVEEGVSPGFVAGLWQAQDSDVFRVSAVGNRRVIPSPQVMFPETVFDLASVTKVFATAALAAVLVDRGWLKWDLPVHHVLPTYPYREVSVSHLLSHTAGYTAWSPFWENMMQYFSPQPLHQVSVEDRQRLMRELVLATVPENPPGHQVLYSDLSFLLLGFVLEEIVQMPLDQAVARFVWQPLGIQGAFYQRVTRSADKQVDETIAATEECSWRGGVLQGQVHDDNCWATGGYAGHAGAFASARDVLHFVRGLYRGFLSPTTLQAMWSCVTEPPGCSRTLGWDTPSGELSSVGHLFSSRTIGHLGFTGTSLWVDQEAGLAVCLLSNRVHPSRDNIKIRTFRSQFHDALRLDLL